MYVSQDYTCILVLAVYASHHMKTATTNATNDGATINSILAPYKISSKKIHMYNKQWSNANIF